MNYLFIDPVCPKPYTLQTLEKETLGGTEATVLRVAKGLIDRLHDVSISQRGNTEASIDPCGLVYWDKTHYPPEFVITLRDAGFYAKARKDYPNAAHYLWLHDVVSGEYLEHMSRHLTGLEHINIICVSNWHMQQVREQLATRLYLKNINFRVIYNPLAEYCTKLNTTYDPFKLVFFSSPHKGLPDVLEIFKVLHKRDARYRLYIANPGYFDSITEDIKGVYNLGSLPHRQIIEHVRTSLCLFYPQTVFAETFGLVLAESNAVGTPVIAHPLGAAPEVLTHSQQLIDCNNIDLVLETVSRWNAGERPILRADSRFLLSSVMRYWERL